MISQATKIKTRFCPSPTGVMHIGNLRTAAFNFFLAKKNHGCFLLRIEDTDSTRSDTNYSKQLQNDLHWLGLTWQEGIGLKDNKNVPYFQSKRTAIYEDYYHALKIKGFAYPCFCTPSDLSLQRKRLLAQGKPPRYLNTCRHLTTAEREKKQAAGLKPSLRFAIPEGGTITFQDIVKGDQSFSRELLGDFIIQRSDGSPSFLFCNALDDALMKVTHVLRGEDHLSNTPRQLMILEALRLTSPQYGHMPLIIGKKGSPLSKRQGDLGLNSFKAQGFLPQAILNHLGRLGHHYTHDTYCLNLEELAQQFDLKKLGQASAHFNIDQLHHWQKLSVANLSIEAFWSWIAKEVTPYIQDDQRNPFINLIHKNILFPKEAAHWARLLSQESLDLSAIDNPLFSEAGSTFFKKAVDTLNSHEMDSLDKVKHWLDSLSLVTNKRGKCLFIPLRLALTGQMHGPEFKPLCQFLGKSKMISRLKQAAQL